ncbi:DUF5329 family protein [Ideonella paludis]|uniref:DUF5329 domain-containing protein n=1 Tax=Ideonella paludis TaxID=1233411 RepID=A0ABS5DXT9_9BURK|nr:DUF5329 domain-containing protein [Ideonella paludis]MBQ0935967.1 DUF5329 domain-containing protein [Ideonella paludis]
MKAALSTLALLLSALQALAAPTPAPIRAEIDALMGKLLASGCQFERNGSLHSGEEAKGHILRKLDYLEGKRTLQSTEQFIELAASRSSSSGKPYFVKCGSAAAVPSQQWLLGQLQSLRAKTKGQ